MRLLVVYCHPVPESFGGAVLNSVCASAESAGHSLDLLDLYAEDFQPVMGKQERRDYHSDEYSSFLLSDHVERLKSCEGLILIYPTWWMSPPAMLKGWLDRVWRPGVAFANADTLSQMRPLLKNIRLIAAISTLGAPWWYWTLVLRNPGSNVLLRSLKSCCNPNCRKLWLSLHNMDSCSDQDRRNFLNRVSKTISKLR